VLATLLEHRTKADNTVKYLVKHQIGIVFCLPEAISNGWQQTANDGVIAGGNYG